MNSPSLNSMSSGFASSICAATAFPFSTILSHAFEIAEPPTASDLEP